MGGLGVFNPTEMTDLSFTTSRWATDVIVQALKVKRAFELDAHVRQLSDTRVEAVKVKEQIYNDKFTDVLGEFDSADQ